MIDKKVVLTNYGDLSPSYLVSDNLCTILCACAARALIIGARCRVNLGKGPDLVYPFSRVPTHPLRALGAAARGRYICELIS